MSYLEEFKVLNSEPLIINSFNINEVRAALGGKYDWSFLPYSAIDAIKRYSMTTVEIIDFLFKYKYVETSELIQMLSYLFGLPFIYLDENFRYRYGKQVDTNLNTLVFKDINGVDNVIFLSIDSLIAEAGLNVEFPGKLNKIFYTIPTNFYCSKNPDYYSNMEWNYYIMFNRYIQYCLDHKASDIHFDVIHVNKKEVYRAMCRIGPDREECTLFPLDARINKELVRETIMNRSSNQTANIDLDAGFGVVVTLSDLFGDGRLEVRFTAERVLSGYLCVCRLHEQKNVSLGLDDLGFDKDIVKCLRDITERPSGLTTFTGKIRTGKNTTMAAVANHIVAKNTNPSLMALDDPIEIVGAYPQVDYRGDVDLLKAGIRLAKKLDLDFVTLNEIPNAEVAFGVRDLVNSSIHTLTTWHMNRIWHAPHKLFEYFGESYRDLISQMNLICNQRLYKRQCQHCLKEVHREDYAPTGEHADERIYKFFVDQEIFSSNAAQGCSMCDYTGYESGRIVVLPEVLVFTQELVLELFKADRPYEMEIILLNHMRGSPLSLERQMCNALSDGRLSPKEILSIV